MRRGSWVARVSAGPSSGEAVCAGPGPPGGGAGGPQWAGGDVRGPPRSQFLMVLPGFLVARA